MLKIEYQTWKYDDSTWTPIIGDNAPDAEPGDPTYDGFGNHYNKYAWSPIIKNETGELSNGFGKTYNIGARSMIEYPKDSGKLFIGTFKLKAFSSATPEEGCDIWRYN